MGNSGTVILVTGAASSGKSEWAEHLAHQQKKSVIYIATAQTNQEDKEWCLKIEKHKRRRPKNWQLQEIPYNLDIAIKNASPQTCLLIDSLGTWVANLLEKNEEDWQLIVTELVKNIKQTKTDLIFVAEETGWGVVPSYKSGRIFRDRLGKLIRHVGTISNYVYLVTGGYAINVALLGEKLIEVSENRI